MSPETTPAPAPPAAAPDRHPVERLLRTERMPHIWCPGCGIGTSLNCFVRAIEATGLDTRKLVVVSGIGCTGRVAGYLALDSFHTTHGRAIPFAEGLALARPDLKVAVYSGDGDLVAIGGNHLIHPARRNVNLTVICVNNFVYSMTGGQAGPTSPLTSVGTTAPYGVYEPPFNLPHLVASCGATYVARWTVYHVRQLAKAMQEALTHPGFSFVEVISPCPPYYGRRNRLGAAVDFHKFYKEKSVVKHGAETRELEITLGSPIVCGKFVDLERPALLDEMNKQLTARLGDKYQPYQGLKGQA